MAQIHVTVFFAFLLLYSGAQGQDDRIVGGPQLPQTTTTASPSTVGQTAPTSSSSTAETPSSSSGITSHSTTGQTPTSSSSFTSEPPSSSSGITSHSTTGQTPTASSSLTSELPSSSTGITSPSTITQTSTSSSSSTSESLPSSTVPNEQSSTPASTFPTAETYTATPSTEWPEWSSPIDTCLVLYEQNGSITSDNVIPESGSYIWRVQNENSEPGYGVEVILESLKINSASGSYFLIAPGLGLFNETDSVQIMTGTITSPLKYRITKNDSFSAMVYFGSANEDFEFVLTYNRTGYKLTTPKPITTNPSPPAHQYAVISVEVIDPVLYGQQSFLDDFKIVFYNMSVQYCIQQGIAYDESKPLNKTIFISSTYPCPDEWPNSLNCVQMAIAAFMVPEDYYLNPDQVYELSPENILNLWTTKGWEQPMTDLGVRPYILDPGNILAWWVLTAVAIVLFLCVLLIIIWRYENLVATLKRLNIKKKEAPKSTGPRSSNMMLSAHQIIPNFVTEDSVIHDRRKESPPFPQLQSFSSSPQTVPTRYGTTEFAAPHRAPGNTNVLLLKQANEYYPEEELYNDEKLIDLDT